jgi:hypothetical protein
MAPGAVLQFPWLVPPEVEDEEEELLEDDALLLPGFSI